MSNLTDLLPAGAGGKQVSFVASGTLTSGQAVALNGNGTVTAVGTNIAEALGSIETFVSGIAYYIASAYDAQNQKIVLAYRDAGNSDYGTAVVGAVSGSTITFGTPVVFEAAQSNDISIAFDSSANKIVITYSDSGNSSYGTAIVGTVSGTSISFGSAVVFEAANTLYTSVVYDSTNEKVVVFYTDAGNSNYGTAIVGTVSGTSISFGTPVIFLSGYAIGTGSVYAASSQKILVAYRNFSNQNRGESRVGTVSGTSISFGSSVTYGGAFEIQSNTTCAYDSQNQKIVVAYSSNETSTQYGWAVVGTISGTSVSYGTRVNFYAGRANTLSIAYDPTAKKITLAYRYVLGTNGLIQYGSVTGTTLTFGSPIALLGANLSSSSLVYAENASKLVVSLSDSTSGSETSHSRTYQPPYSISNTSFIGITDAAISDTASGSVTIKGGISTNVTGLTPNALYYVQTDGSISSPTAPYPYNLSGGVYDSVSLAVSDNLTSIFFKPDGTKMYAIGYTNDTVYEYGLSSAFDLSSASLNGNTKNISAQSGYTPSIVFKSDGTKMYALGGGSVFQYSLSTAWDVSSASYDSKSLSVSSQDSNSSGIWFKSDGTEMYMCGFTNDSIFQYNLSTPWDVSSGSYASISFNMSATSTQPRNMYFDSTGTILFLADTANPDKVFKFVLSTAWDITTISFSSSLDVSAQAAKAVDVVLNADGTKMYVADSENTNTIYQYTLKGSTSTVLAGKALSSTSINLDYTT